MKALGHETTAALTSGDLDAFGECLTAQWALKFDRFPHPDAPAGRHLDPSGIEAGASGGKLVGAGDGGFLLFYAEDKAGVRAEMAAIGLNEVRFGIDYLGTSVIVPE